MDAGMCDDAFWNPTDRVLSSAQSRSLSVMGLEAKPRVGGITVCDNHFEVMSLIKESYDFIIVCMYSKNSFWHSCNETRQHIYLDKPLPPTRFM